jgi:hypothetical protein
LQRNFATHYFPIAVCEWPAISIAEAEHDPTRARRELPDGRARRGEIDHVESNGLSERKANHAKGRLIFNRRWHCVYAAYLPRGADCCERHERDRD